VLECILSLARFNQTHGARRPMIAAIGALMTSTATRGSQSRRQVHKTVAQVGFSAGDLHDLPGAVGQVRIRPMLCIRW
jgi:hypothetical protein